MSYYNKYLKYKNKYLELSKNNHLVVNMKGGSNSASPITPWNCPKCTYSNKNLDYECEVCLTTRASTAPSAAGGGSMTSDALPPPPRFPIPQSSASDVEHCDYYVSSHGATLGTFKLPPNVRVIMLCNEGGMTSCKENEFRIYSTLTKSFGINLEMLDLYYNSNETEKISSLRYKLCIFSPNFNSDYLIETGILKSDQKRLFDETCVFSNKCPNLVLTDERITFRTGIFSVPLDFNRIYINDHVSTTTGKKIKAGTTEKITTEELFIRESEQKKAGTLRLNRLESLLIKPIPSYSSLKRGAEAQKEVETFISHNSKDVVSALENMISLNSVIVPNPDSYTPLESYNDRRGNCFLSYIVDDLSKKNPDKVVNIIIATCRGLHEQEPASHKPEIGIDLHNMYLTTTLGIINPSGLKLKIDKQQENIDDLTFADIDRKIFNHVLSQKK